MRVIETTSDRVRPLQRLVLRPNGPLPADREAPPDWHHWAVVEEDSVVAAASAGPAPVPAGSGLPNPMAGSVWQLRSMAVAPDRRRAGIGLLLLRALVSQARAAGVAVLWAEVRTEALGLYERAGWQALAEVWRKPGVGPHRYAWVDLQRQAEPA